ncbi:P-loop containing nucleoside triphosphate hydrolase protein [Podospora appendiculata]|uniref:RNA helicase n=1 Tax=Podospora appendiculata TaxID=314037 RepID=A0AAE1CFX6_9PEZI|nr:P-loop containing nucleoside triphosphate hydrolase protein [Podospora appendiculata]
MLRTARESVCLICRSAGTPARVARRTFATRLSEGRDGRDRRTTPARMVLSDHVGRSAAARDDGPRRPRNAPDGPFAGMNRTTANIDPRRAPPATTAPRSPRSTLRPAPPPSDRPAQPREPRAPYDDSNKQRNRPDGPFAGMNRTTANIDPFKAMGAAGAKAGETRDGAERGDREGRRDRRGGRNEKGTMKALNMQRALTTINYGQRNSIKDRMQVVESFEQFDLLPIMQEAIVESALQGMVDIKPTPVQRLAIPALLGQRFGPKPRTKRAPPARSEYLLAAETGSGKTLAYLLPTINALKLAEADDTAAAAYEQRLADEKARRGVEPLSHWIENFEPHPNAARPRVVVLVPTAELVDQVTRVAKSIAHVAKLKVRALSSSFSALKNQRNLFSNMGVDMIIATPHLLRSIATSDPNVLSRVSHLVIDEADSLLDRSFSPETIAIVDRAMPSLKQLILCSATIPLRLDNFLAERFPDINRITTPNLHAIPRRVQLGVIDVSKDPYRNNKNLACADAIWTIGKEAAAHQSHGAAAGPPGEIDVKRIMVFVNERETTTAVAEYLQGKGIDAVALHRDAGDQREKDALLADFTSSAPMKTTTEAAAALANGRRHLANTKVIVATDIASRGIDTLAVKHVVLYDVPHTTIDFIHRLGRAGRMGRRGRGIVLVGKDDRRDVVAEVKQSMFTGAALV